MLGRLGVRPALQRHAVGQQVTQLAVRAWGSTWRRPVCCGAWLPSGPRTSLMAPQASSFVRGCRSAAIHGTSAGSAWAPKGQGSCRQARKETGFRPSWLLLPFGPRPSSAARQRAEPAPGQRRRVLQSTLSRHGSTQSFRICACWLRPSCELGSALQVHAPVATDVSQLHSSVPGRAETSSALAEQRSPRAPAVAAQSPQPQRRGCNSADTGAGLCSTRSVPATDDDALRRQHRTGVGPFVATTVLEHERRRARGRRRLRREAWCCRRGELGAAWCVARHFAARHVAASLTARCSRRAL